MGISLVIILAMSPFMGTDLPERLFCTIRTRWYYMYLGRNNLIDAKMQIRLFIPNKIIESNVNITGLPPAPLSNLKISRRLYKPPVGIWTPHLLNRNIWDP